MKIRVGNDACNAQSIEFAYFTYPDLRVFAKPHQFAGGAFSFMPGNRAHKPWWHLSLAIWAPRAAFPGSNFSFWRGSSATRCWVMAGRRADAISPSPVISFQYREETS